MFNRSSLPSPVQSLRGGYNNYRCWQIYKWCNYIKISYYVKKLIGVDGMSGRNACQRKGLRWQNQNKESGSRVRVQRPIDNRIYWHYLTRGYDSEVPDHEYKTFKLPTATKSPLFPIALKDTSRLEKTRTKPFCVCKESKVLTVWHSRMTKTTCFPAHDAERYWHHTYSLSFHIINENVAS